MKKPLSLVTKQSTALSRPFEAINEIIDILSVSVTYQKVSYAKRLPLYHNNLPVCYILKEGLFSFRTHGTGRVVSYIPAPFLIGFNEFITPSYTGYFRAESDGMIAVVTKEIFLQKLLASNKLMMSMFSLQTYIIKRLSVRDFYINTPDSMDLIKYHLVELQNHPAYIKDNISVSRYVLDHTSLSRSTVMRILSILRTDGQISFGKNGKLLKINFNFENLII